MLNNIRFILFDWDGTLVDSFAFLLKGHNETRAKLGMGAVAHAEFYALFGKPRDLVYQTLYGELAVEARQYFTRYVEENHKKDIHAQDGAEDLLKTIKTLNIPCGVITNKQGSFVRNEINALGWAEYFVTVVGAGEAPQDKPAADPVFFSIKQAGLTMDATDVCVIGDTEADAGCAVHAGCGLILVGADVRTNKPWVSRYKPLLKASDCMEIKHYLLQRQ